MVELSHQWQWHWQWVEKLSLGELGKLQVGAMVLVNKVQRSKTGRLVDGNKQNHAKMLRQQ